MSSAYLQKIRSNVKELSDQYVHPNISPSLERRRIIDFDPTSNGLWNNELPIPMDVAFEYYEKTYIVKKSGINDIAGEGLFVLENLHKDDILFPYGGPRYKLQHWKQLCAFYPRMKTYALVENDMRGVPESEIRIIMGDVEEGNVAGYINSSIFNKALTNVKWEYVPFLKPWRSQNSTNPRDYGFVATIATKDIEAGSELFTEYPFDKLLTI